MSNGDSALSFLFSRENRPYTIAIIAAVLALVVFLLLDSGSDGTRTVGTTATGASSGAIGALSDEDCVAAAQAMASATAGLGGTALDQADIDIAFARMAGVAPTAIQADLAVVAGALDDFFTAVAAAGVDLSDPNTMASAEAQAALAHASADLDASGYENAAANVTAWFESECGAGSG